LAERLEYLASKSNNCGRIGYINCTHDGPACSALIGHFLGSGFPFPVADNHAEAITRQPQGDSRADASTRTCDDGDGIIHSHM
jgi:hypothetical protein